MKRIPRRNFLSDSLGGAVALSTLASGAVGQASASSNEKVALGVVGTGGMGRSHIGRILARSDVVIAGLCDVDENALGRAASIVESKTGKKPKLVGDFRRLLDDPSIDALLIATPHHWHCPIAIPAIQAGKGVYLEKIGSHVFREGRVLVEASRKHQRIFQHGTQMRSSAVTAKAGEILESGLLGEIKMARAWNVQRHAHRQPVPDAPTPPGVNYDLWLGPAPQRPFNPNRFSGYWNWFRDYGNGDIGGDGIHDIDMARWGLGVNEHPIRITSHGSRIALKGIREFPDTMTVSYQYADQKVLVYEERAWAPYGMNGFDSSNAFYGTEGYMIFSRRGHFQVFLGASREPGPSMRSNPAETLHQHLANFIDCVRTRKPTIASAEEAHLSCALVHLGEVGYRVSRVLNFDPPTETIQDDPEANAMLTKKYRRPWTVPDRV